MNRIITDKADFEMLVKCGDIYVDKTRYVHALIDSGASYFFIARPCGYGKSLFCETLKAVFEGKKELFENCYIGKTGYDFEKYPVFQFNFALLETSITFEILKNNLEEMVRHEALRNGIELEGKGSPAILMDEALRKLEKKAVIIIDEFDIPIINSLEKTYLKEVKEMFSSFYRVVKNRFQDIRFFFMTGVTKYSNQSIFSEMNNLIDLTLDSRFASAFGFTKAEISEYFADRIEAYSSSSSFPYADREAFLSAMASYYDGYRFSGDSEEKVFNPVSIGRFFESGCIFANYWNNTGLSNLAINLARQYDLLGIIEDSIPEVPEDSFDSFDIFGLYDKRLSRFQVLVLLFYTGYLTISGKEDSFLKLSFPNKEVSSVLSRNCASIK